MTFKTIITAAVLCGWAGAAGAAFAQERTGFAPELSERHGVVLFEDLARTDCDPAPGGDPLGGARLEHRLGAVLSRCARLRIAAAAAAALDRGDTVRWRLNEGALRGVALPGPEAERRPGACREVRLETYTARGDIDERTLVLCRQAGEVWRVAPEPRRGRFSRSG